MYRKILCLGIATLERDGRGRRTRKPSGVDL